MVTLGYQLAGMAGAVAATIALLQPPFLILLTAGLYARLSHLWRTHSALLMVSLSVAGSLAYTAWQIVSASSVDAWGWIMALVAFVITLRTRWSPVLVLGGAALAGVA